MKRDFLSGLKLDTEVIDKIMEEHGKTVNKLKDDLSKSEGEKKLLGEQIEDYKKNNADIDKLIKENEKLKGSNEDLKNNYETIQNEFNSTIEKHSKEMSNIAKKQIIEKSLNENGVISDFQDYLMSKFDIDNMELDGDRIKDFDNTFNKIKENNPKMFQEKKLTGTGTPNQGIGNMPSPEISQLNQQLDEARKSGDTALAMSLNEQIFGFHKQNNNQ